MAKALKIGLMVPSNNTTMAREMLVWLPAGSTCNTLKIPRGKGMLTPETLPAYVGEALKLAQAFETPDTDVVAYGCTAAGFMSGPAGDASLQGDLTRITGKPVVTTARSMVESLQSAGVKHIALVTPYLEATNIQLKAFLADGGIAVKRFNSFYAQNTDELGRIEAHQVAALARETMRDDCEALFIGCSQLPTAEILGDLQREFGRPAFSSIQVTARRAQQAAATAEAV